MSVRAIIEAVALDVTQAQGITLPKLTDDTPLLDSGLDSLCLAIIVSRLEDQLGKDPFASDDDVALPVTFGDFVRLYESALV